MIETNDRPDLLSFISPTMIKERAGPEVNRILREQVGIILYPGPKKQDGV